MLRCIFHKNDYSLIIVDVFILKFCSDDMICFISGLNTFVENFSTGKKQQPIFLYINLT